MARVAFVLASHSRSPLASTRIAVLNMFPALRAAGYEPEIVHEPEQPSVLPAVDGLEQRLVDEGYDIVFLQKVHGPSVERLARRLGELGIATVFGVCDVIEPGMVEATDVTVAVTEYLRSLYPPHLQSKIHVVHDGIENPAVHKLDYGTTPAGERHPLQAVLVTSSLLTDLPVLASPPAWLNVTIVGPYPGPSTPLRRLRDAARQLRDQPSANWLPSVGFAMSSRIRCVPWHPVRVYQELQAADVGIIPVDEGAPPHRGETVPAWQVKSENRLTLKMCMGLPVVASPVPSYAPVVDQGVNGFILTSRADWLACLDALREPALRRQIGQRARQAVLERYSQQEQARRLIAALQAAHAQRRGVDAAGRSSPVSA
jgi:glycosyltransferase involved in cell wall biosynthesis